MKTAVTVILSLLIHVSVADALCNVKDYGAVGDGVADDRVSIQNAINNCAATGDYNVYVPPGTYKVTQSPSGFYCLNLPSKVKFFGAGQALTTLIQAPGIGGSVRLLRPVGEDGEISDLTLDGNKDNQTRIPALGAEHRHGIFADATKRLKVTRVTARKFTGDGLYLYTESVDTVISFGSYYENDRSGIALAQHIVRVKILYNDITENGVQQIDSEPVITVVDDIIIKGNVIKGTGVNGYLITISGSGSATRSTRWIVSDNELFGPTFAVWVDTLVFSNNIVYNTVGKSGVKLYRSIRDAQISNNTIVCTQTTENYVGGIEVTGTSAANQPTSVLISGNVIKVANPTGFGVWVHNAESVNIVGNEIQGGGVPSALSAGIYLRAVEGELFRSATIRNNKIYSYGKYGVAVAGNVVAGNAARIQLLDISGNTFDDKSETIVMPTAIKLDDGSGVAKKITVSENSLLGNVTTLLTSIPPNAVILTSGNVGFNPVYSVGTNPEGSVVANPGAMAIARDTGKIYFKESTPGLTGWVQK